MAKTAHFYERMATSRLEDVPEPECRHVAQVRVSLDLLAEMLFPEGATILKVWQPETYRVGGGEIALIVEHADLPKSCGGEEIPEVSPQFRSGYTIKGTCGVKTLWFDSWGLQYLPHKKVAGI